MSKNRISAGLIVAAVLVGIAVGVLPPLLTGITGLWFITPVLAGLIILGLFISNKVLVLLSGVLLLFSIVLTAFISPVNLSEDQRERHAAVGNFIAGEVYWARGQFTKALTAYKAARRLGMDQLWITYQIASSYTRSGDAYNGFQELTVLKNKYESFPAWLIQSDYAKLLVSLENFDRAEKAFEEAIRANYNPGEAYFNFAIFYLQMGRLDEAQEKMESAHFLGYDRSACSVILGKIHENRGEFEQAEEYFRRALRENAENLEAYTRLGLVLSRYQRRLVEAEEVFKQGMVYLGWMPVPNPRAAAEFLGAYGENYARMDLPGKAEVMFEISLNTDPTWMEGYIKLADIYAGTGRVPQAISVLQVAQQVNPTYHPAKQMLDILTAPPADTSGTGAQ